MKQFNNWEKAKENARHIGGSAQLPVGGYVAKIKDVRYENGENGNSDRIVIAFDITEGDYKDFFQKQFEANTSEDKKWKGKATIYCPKDDGSEKDQWTQNAFMRWVNALEDSNKGYVWDWNESKWKGLTVGLIYGETGTVIEGREIVYTEVHNPAAVEEIRNNTFKAPKLKKKNGFTGDGSGTSNNSTTSDNGFVNIPEGQLEELPF